MEKILETLYKILNLFLLPTIILNMLGGIASGIWLLCLGMWSDVVVGLILGLFSNFWLGLVLMVGFLFAGPAIFFGQRKGPSRYLAYIFGFLSSLWTHLIIIIWCIGSFYLFMSKADSRSWFPLLIWSYGVATGPWVYMASKEKDNPYTMMSAIFCQIGYIILMLVSLFISNMIINILIFCIIMLIPQILQTIIFIQEDIEKQRVEWA